MILPASVSLSKTMQKVKNGKHSSIHKFCGLVLCMINFVPIFHAITEHSNHPPLSLDLRLWFAISFVLSVPLWLEYCIDLLMKLSNSRTSRSQDVLDYNFGHSGLLVSLSAPLYLYYVRDYGTSNLLFADCFVAACRTLALVSIFKKLQQFSNGHWNVCNSLPIITVLVAAEVQFSFGMSSCGMMRSECDLSWLDYPKTFIAVCLALNTYFARLYIYEFYKYWFTKRRTKFFNTNRSAALILVLIVEAYLLTRFLMVFTLECLHTDAQGIMEVQIAVHAILACLAAILPGRMVRRMFATMKNEMEYKETFVRYISHEIRSPLATTTLGLDYLNNKLSSGVPMDTGSILDVVRDARYATDTATNTLNDLLMYDKIETGMLELATEKCDMWEFVRHCTRPFSLQASDMNVSLNWYLEAELSLTDTVDSEDSDLESQHQQLQQSPTAVSAIMVKVDKYKMEQVVRNFMTNALKFTPSGGAIDVKVSLQSCYSSTTQQLQAHQEGLSRESSFVTSNYIVRLEVKDTGAGISEKNLPKLFGQYVQFDANTLQGGKGSGLGLWLSKAIVEMHGGVIGATSAGGGQGCTFFLELPVTELCVDQEKCTGGEEGSINVMQQDTHAHFPSKGEGYEDSGIGLPPSNDANSSNAATDLKNSAPHGQVALNLGIQIPSTSPPHQSPSRRGKKVLDSPVARLARLSLVKGKKSPTVATITKRAKVYKELTEAEIPSPLAFPALNVLMVDDSLISRKMVARTLAALDGCVCHHASNGQEAIDSVVEALAQTDSHQQPFDVILMDYYMPVMNGPEAVRILRSPLCSFKGLILAVTGVSAESEFDSLLEAGLIDHILVKPFDVEVFKTVVGARLKPRV